MNAITTGLGALAATLALARADTTSSCSVPPGPGYANHQVAENSTTWPWQVFESSNLNPPNLSIQANGKPLSPGYVFFEPSAAGTVPVIKQSADWIMTQQNELVYGNNVSGTTDFRVQYYNGNPYLTYWSGYNTNGANVGHGYGSVTFLDQTYKPVYNVCPALNLTTEITPSPKCQIDIHEHQMTPNNTILLSAYNTTQANLESVGGPKNGWVNDCLFYVVEPATNKVLFHWSALAHVPVNASHQPLNGAGQNSSTPWDWFHINAIDTAGDNYIVNSRHTWSTYMVSSEDGHIMWTINGETGGDFGTLPANGTFRWQHFSRVHNLTSKSITLSWFDNHNSMVDNGTEPTKGLALQLSLPPSKKVSPVVLRHIEVASQEVYAESQGSYITDLPNDNQFMGYGQLPLMREYGPDPDGNDLRWEGRFGPDNTAQSYRAFKQEWHAVPYWNPSLALKANGSSSGQCGCANGFVSWNGATDVQTWNIYEGASASSLTLVGHVPFRGFETGFDVPAKGCVQAEAVVNGTATRKSNVACL